MSKSRDNSGAVRIIKAMRGQSQTIFNLNKESNMLGTMTATGIYIDAVDDEIPNGDFSFLQMNMHNTGSSSVCEVTKPKPGDRVLCTPVGVHFVVLGRVE